MAYNPYAAPTPQPPMAGGHQPMVGGGPQPWSVGEVIGLGWEAVKRSWVVLIFAPFVAQLIGGIPGQIPNLLAQSGAITPGDDAFGIVTVVFGIVGFVVGVFFQVGQIRIFLKAARGEEPDFMLIFSGADRFLPLLGVSFLVAIAVYLGFLLLIVPGVILGLGLCLSSFYCVDQNMGVMDSMKASWEATKGQKGDIFLFGLASVGVALLGLLACCVGIYAAIPVLGVGFAIAYLRISGAGGGTGGFGMAGPPPGMPPGGGFGAPAAGFGGPQGGFGGPQGGFGGPQGGFGGPQGGGFGGPQGGGFGGPQGGGFGGPPAGGGQPGGGGFGGPPAGGGQPGGGGFGGPPAGGGQPGGGGGYGPPPGGGGGYGPPPGGGGGYGPPPGGGGYGPPPGGGGYGG